MPSVVLVSMPFAGRLQSSLALSSLCASLEPDPVDVHVRYYCLDFADLLDVEAYDRISDGEPFSQALAGEWVFASGVVPGERLPAADYAAAVSADERPAAAFRADGTGEFDDELLAYMEAASDRADAFLERCCSEIVELRPAVVGFTSVFQQQLASLGLAARLKAAIPEVTIVFGGANCDGPMGRQVVESFEAVDAVVIGEAEAAFPELVRAVLAGRPPATVAGVVQRSASALAVGPPAPTDPIDPLDDLPVPDQSDYFEQFAASRHGGRPRVLFESSRGCWWGERRHCTFCGLNRETMRYRSKSATRALVELAELAERYPGLAVAAVDNILDRSYFADVLPVLAEDGPELDLFFEVKANLTRDQVRLLRDAGIRDVQPGIESLGNGILRQMQKGVTGLQNIQLLKWCTEFGVHPTWNILWGFLDEDPAEYQAMADLVPSLFHLTPPLGAGPVRLDRFSPLFDRLAFDGSKRVRPAAAYPLLYRLGEREVGNLSYFFHMEPPVGLAEYTSALRRAVAAWAAAHQRSALFFFDSGDELTIWRCRDDVAEPFRLPGSERDIYLALDQVRSTSALRREFGDDIEDRLAGMRDRDLVVSMGDAHVALAVEVGDYQPPTWTLPHVFAELSSSARQ